MNAYEIADELDGRLDHKAANMLRQQADRIAELEKELYFKNYYEELPDTPVGIIGKIGDSPIHDLVHRTTPKIKELSDEEIEQIASQYLSAHAQFIGAGEVCYEGEIEFARAILKKASEK